MMLSAMSIDKGMKKGNETILAALVELKPDVTVEVRDCVAELLKKFVDAMSPELQRLYRQGEILTIKFICCKAWLLLHNLLMICLIRNWLNCGNS